MKFETASHILLTILCCCI